ncbi:MAG: GTP-binding protein [Calditrichaeota bacterium]|nr:MAG: GTP-binding protein [Calditrichota bacterium]
MNMPLYLVTGFLGSGKTTFVSRFLERYASAWRLGLIQNEFGPLNIDGRQLRQSGVTFELLEINRGSVFCVCLISSFKDSLCNFVDEYHPDAVLLEATGLADPLGIAELFSAAELQSRLFLDKTWCIIDASTFLLLEPVNHCIRHQIRVADEIIINKIDRVNEQTLYPVKDRIEQLNPAARLTCSMFCDVDLNLDFSTPNCCNNQSIVAQADAVMQTRPSMQTAVVKTTHRISGSRLQHFLSSQGSELYRLKGFVQLADGSAVSLQFCFGETRIIPLMDYSGPTELVAIGPTLSQPSFVNEFRSCFI